MQSPTHPPTHQPDSTRDSLLRHLSPTPNRTGEVHLETCIKDLRERFARCDLVVSPPLVAFRESVFCWAEVPAETTARPVFTVEATTPGGACTLRVQALPLPAAVATALDQNADLLRLAYTAAGKAGGGGGGGGAAEQQHQQQAAAAAAGADDLGGGTGAAGSASLAALGERLRQLAAGEEVEGLQPLLQRAWLFGPKRVGPNLLLAAPVGDAAEVASSSLFALPSERVVKLGKQQAGRSAALLLAPAGGRQEVAAAAEAAADAAADAAAEAVLQERHLAVPLGFPEVALKLGLASGSETATSAASAAVADLASQLDGLDVAPGGGAGGAAAAAGENGSAPAAAAAATAATPTEGAGLGDSLGGSLEYLRYAVESGVAAGFQLASAAGPLCDEPLWGVAFAVEARLNLPPGCGGGSGGGGDTATSAAASLALSEDVYGPFSGQVTSAARQALRRAVLEADPRLVEALFLCEVRAGHSCLLSSGRLLEQCLCQLVGVQAWQWPQHSLSFCSSDACSHSLSSRRTPDTLPPKQVATSSEGLSAVYAVLGRRRARILREEMREGSDLFTVHAYLPAEASFGFADELRRRSSGAAAASLMLSHWERLQVGGLN